MFPSVEKEVIALQSNFPALKSTAITAFPIKEDAVYLRQGWWCGHMFALTASTLLAQALPRDKVRISSQRQPGSSGWMGVVPVGATNAEFSSAEFAIALRWWLGIALAPSEKAGSACQHCGDSRDVHGACQ